MRPSPAPCKPWCRSVAHGARGYCTRACRDRAERNGTAEDRPNRLLMVGGIPVPEWAPLYDEPEDGEGRA